MILFTYCTGSWDPVMVYCFTIYYKGKVTVGCPGMLSVTRLPVGKCSEAEQVRLHWVKPKRCITPRFCDFSAGDKWPPGFRTPLSLGEYVCVHKKISPSEVLHAIQNFMLQVHLCMAVERSCRFVVIVGMLHWFWRQYIMDRYLLQQATRGMPA